MRKHKEQRVIVEMTLEEAALLQRFIYDTFAVSDATQDQKFAALRLARLL